MFIIINNMLFTNFIIFVITLIINVNAENENDANWMSHLSNYTYINEINIPGTHDSGTRDTVWTKAPWSETQSLSIKEQLEHGIRYLDLRLTVDDDDWDNKLYITHDGAKCYDDSGTLYFSEVLNDCINFVSDHSLETVIIHLKSEALPERITKYPNRFDNILAFETILNSSIIRDKKVSEYFYNENYIPNLGGVRGKIVLLTRYDLNYNYTLFPDIDKYYTGKVGNTITIPEMGNCYEYRSYDSDQDRDTDGEKCYPIINGYIRVQDNYNLEKDDKWDMVHDVLRNKVQSRNYTDNTVVDDLVTEQFYNTKNRNVLTINFMNMARASDEKGFKGWFSRVMDSIFDSSIEKSATHVNNELIKYTGTIYNQWIILDFPSPDVIRKIYQSNNYIDSNLIKKEVKIEELDIYKDTDYYAIQTPFGYKRDEYNEIPKACLQRKFVIDENGNQHDTVKTNYKCIKNKLNQWRIKQNGSYYNIVSAYDGKCLNYSDNSLNMQKCKNNNKYEDFTIKDGIICSRLNSNKCLDGNYDFHPIILQSKKYDNLTCSTRFAKRGVKCCSNQNTQVQYVDDIGNWGIENGELCGIGYTRCSFSVLGYDCCSSVNPEVVQTDENGNTWGFEDGQWCGIGEVNFNSNVRIRNIKNNSCLVTYPSNNNSNSDRLVLGDCDTEYSSWSILGNKIISDYTNKCLYVNNGIDTAMDSCDEIIDGKNDHYIHFDIIDDKYICVKYNLDSQKCFNGKNLRFITSNDGYSEWAIERPNNNVVDSIKSIIESNHSIKIATFDPKVITATTTSTPEPTSECHSIYGYPCCSPEITQVINIDEEGSWSLENGNWCLINKTTTTTSTTTTTTTSTSTPEPTSECHSLLGYPCCSPEITQVINTDKEGNWGSENGDWCLIVDNSQDIINNTESECPYDGYPCCSSNNSKFYFSDESGI